MLSRQDAKELRVVRRHQRARRVHKRAVRVEDVLSNTLARQSEKVEKASYKHRDTKTAVQNLF